MHRNNWIESLLLIPALFLVDGCSASSTPGASPAVGDASSAVDPDASLLDASADAEVDGGSTRNVDAGSDASTCSPGDVSTFKPTYHPPHAWEGACSSDEVDAFVSMCLDGNPNSAGCTDFATTHVGCERCIDSEAKYDSYGPIIWYADGNYSRANEPGCVALVDHDTGAAGCAAAHQAVLQCGDASCRGCSTREETASFGACDDKAYESTCSEYLATFQTKCAQLDVLEKYAACRRGAGTSFHDYVTSIVSVFCLRAESDAGADVVSHD